MVPKVCIACVFLAGWCVSLAAWSHSGAKDSAFSQIQFIVKTLSEITGMDEKRIKKTLRPEEIRADETALKMFGLVPQNFDLKKSTIDLLTEQAAAFYDYDDKKLFMLEGSSVEEEVTTLAHELSHALADQHFDLNKYMDEGPENDDENLARTAVVEGQATWLMIAYNLKASGQPVEPTPEMLKTFVNSSEGSTDEYPVLKQSPLYVRESLLFPYSDGTTFFEAVYKREGKKSFEGVFKDPPVDSAQIIHPDRYFSHEKATKPELPKVPSLGHEDEISEGSVGEFDHKILLQQYVGAKEAEALEAHLRGGQFKILGTGKAHRPVLVYASEWDSEVNAQEYFLDYQKVLESKWKHCEVSTAREGVFAGQGDNGFFVARLSGTIMTSVEGLPDGQQQRELTSSQGSSAYGHQVVFARRR